MCRFSCGYWPGRNSADTEDTYRDKTWLGNEARSAIDTSKRGARCGSMAPSSEGKQEQEQDWTGQDLGAWVGHDGAMRRSEQKRERSVWLSCER